MPRKRKGERADGRIQIRLDIGRDAEGRRVRKCFYGKTRAEAEMKKAAYLGRVTGKSYNAEVTLSEWVEEYQRIYPSRANPLYAAQNAVPFNRLKTALGFRLLSSIREADLQLFLNGMAKYSASTISKQLQATRAVFQKARKNKLIPDNPAEDLLPPSGSRGTHRALSQDEIRLIMKHYPLCYSGLWVMLMLFAGLRRGEMIALKWSDVDLKERTLSVRHVGVIVSNRVVVEERTKTRAGVRVIPLGQPLYEALLSVPESKRSGFVCLNANHKPLTETSVRRGVDQFVRVLSRAETGQALNQKGRRTDKDPEPPPLFSFRCHDLRHTFCTLMYDHGVDVQTAAYLMGHSDVTVTMKIYTHLSEERKKKSNAALLDFFAELEKPT